MQAPNPDTKPTPAVANTLVSKKTPVFDSWAHQFAWQLAAQLGVALMFTWLA